MENFTSIRINERRRTMPDWKRNAPIPKTEHTVEKKKRRITDSISSLGIDMDKLEDPDYDTLRGDKKRLHNDITPQEKAELDANTFRLMQERFGPTGGMNIIPVRIMNKENL